MIKWLVLLGAGIWVVPALGQKAPEKIHLKKITDPIEVDRHPDTLYRYKPIDFGIKHKSGKKPAKVELRGGGCREFEGRYWVSAQEGLSAILVVYDVDAKGDTVPVWKCTYPVVGEEPVVKVAGTPDGQTVERLALGYYGIVTVEFPQSGVYGKVLGFTMELVTNGVLDTLRASDAFLTATMKDRLSRVGNGTMVTFRNIAVRMPDGFMQVIPVVRIYVNRSSVNKFGN